MVVVNLGNIVNFTVFLGLTFATYTVFYFSSKMNTGKGITMSIFILSLGINLIGLSHLFRSWEGGVQSPFVTTTLTIGSIFTFFGVITTFREKAAEITSLRKRQEEIKSIMNTLKEKYYSEEISEEELKSLHTSLLKELAEIEVKLNEEIKERSK